MLHFIHTGERKKNPKRFNQLEKCQWRGHVLSDGLEFNLTCCPHNDYQTTSCVKANGPLHWSWPGWCVWGLIPISDLFCHVNGCKNIIRPVSSDRLPPLVPAATGVGMGVHINLLGNLWEPWRRAQKQAVKSSWDTWLTFLSTLRLNRYDLERLQRRRKNYH